VAKVGTSKAGSTISQIGCGTSVACHGKPITEEEEEAEHTNLSLSLSLSFCVNQNIFSALKYNPVSQECRVCIFKQ
jgi:hypothetical protein